MTETSRKPPRSRISEAEEQRMAELYKSGEYSLRDIADQFDTNPTSVSRILKAAGVEMRKPGVSDLAIRNMKRNNKIRAEQRKREAEVRLAEEIAAARRRERVDAKADSLQQELDQGNSVFGASQLQEEARASVALDGETQVIGVPLDEPRTEIRWQPREGEHIAHAQTTAERVHQVDELLAEVGFLSARLPHGHLVWQPLEGAAEFDEREWLGREPLPEAQGLLPQELVDEYAQTTKNATDDDHMSVLCFAGQHDRCVSDWCTCPHHQAKPVEPEPSVEEMAAEHAAELDRVHTWSKEQWGAGVRHGYESATNGVADLLRECIKETAGHAAEALTEFLEMLEDGEHFYRQRKDKKPWLNPRNWEERR